MMTLRCIIADDEPIARQILEGYCKEVSHLEIVASCKNAFEVMNILQNESIDLLFLDINMPKLSGISLLKTLSNPPKVIITTAYPEHALEGYELSVIDYLLKPISFERFLKAVLKVKNEAPFKSKDIIQSKETTSFMVKSDKRLIKVNFEDISHIEAYGNYVKIHELKKSILTPMTMSSILENLPQNFIRAHKSFVFNIGFLKMIDGNQIVLSNGTKLPLSKSFRKEVMSKLG